ncbi:MAG: FAD-dependent oxidoreductase [Alphaproteobacteria bacterium]
MAPARQVTVIGAGIVGLGCALYLQRDGHTVTLIDRDGPGEGTSYGNAGILATSSVIPNGTPGLWKKVPGMLADPLAPLAVRWSYLPKIAPWLVRFLAASRRAAYERISRELAPLSLQAIEHYEPLLADAGALDLIRRQGTLYLYESQASLDAAAEETNLRRALGVRLDRLGPEEVRQFVPGLGAPVAGAMYAPDTAHTINPLGLSQAFADHFQAAGGTIRRAEVRGFTRGPQGPTAIHTSDGELPADQVVIAAGAYARQLTRQLGWNPPLDTERGYHVMLPHADIGLRAAMLVQGRGFGVTPMAEGLRLAGTVELGGLDAPPNWDRAEILLTHAKQLFPDLDTSDPARWMGYRPSLPDSLPVIGRAPDQPNLYFAFGHAHLGLTQGAVTGRIVADLVAGRTPVIDPRPYRIDRF